MEEALKFDVLLPVDHRGCVRDINAKSLDNGVSHLRDLALEDVAVLLQHLQRETWLGVC